MWFSNTLWLLCFWDYSILCLVEVNVAWLTLLTLKLLNVAWRNLRPWKPEDIYNTVEFNCIQKKILFWSVSCNMQKCISWKNLPFLFTFSHWKMMTQWPRRMCRGSWSSATNRGTVKHNERPEMCHAVHKCHQNLLEIYNIIVTSNGWWITFTIKQVVYKQ